jgi:hypothetical protein
MEVMLEIRQLAPEMADNFFSANLLILILRDRIGRFCAIGGTPFKAQRRDFLYFVLR